MGTPEHDVERDRISCVFGLGREGTPTIRTGRSSRRTHSP